MLFCFPIISVQITVLFSNLVMFRWVQTKLYWNGDSADVYAYAMRLKPLSHFSIPMMNISMFRESWGSSQSHRILITDWNNALMIIGAAPIVAWLKAGNLHRKCSSILSFLHIISVWSAWAWGEETLSWLISLWAHRGMLMPMNLRLYMNQSFEKFMRWSL